MPATLTTISVALEGRVAGDVTALDVDGSAVSIGADLSWRWSGVVPAGTTTVALTASAPTRRVTRMVELVRTDLPSGPV